MIVGCGEHRLTRLASDVELFELYSDQDRVEQAKKWLKGPLRVAPIFLELPERIAALGVVYVIALMVNALIQRDVRRQLAKAGTTMPGNKGWTAKPTTQVLFRLFDGIRTMRDPRSGKTMILNVNTEQVRVFDLLGVRLKNLDNVIVATPREPVSGERAWKPKPRGHWQAPPRKRGRKKSKDG